MEVTTTCPECLGTGKQGVGCAINQPAMKVTCLRCNGHGTVAAETGSPSQYIMLRCPHCKQRYEAEIGNNPLVRDGLTITPVPIEIPMESETEQ